MAIAGNSPRKSQQTSEIKADNTETSDDNVSDNDSKESESGTLLDKSAVKTATLKLTKYAKLSEDDVASTEEHFQTFLLETARRSDSRVYDMIKLHGKKANFYQGERILSQGETGMFMFIVFSGCVNVLTSEGVFVRRLGVGEIFGEMSVLFDHPVSANIIAYTDTSVVSIPKKTVQTLMKEALSDVDVIDWCIRRRYLPLGKSVDSGRTCRRLALSVFRTIPTFMSWSEDMIKNLIISMKDRLVFLYPKKSYIAMEGDPLTFIFILVHGAVELTQGKRTVATLDIKSTDDPFVFTESTLYHDNLISVVNVQALTTCQIIQVRRDNVMDVLDNFPEQLLDYLETCRLFGIFKARLGGPLYKQYEADIQFEILFRYLKSYSFYAKTDVCSLQKMLLKSYSQVYHLGQRINIDDDVDVFESILIVRGELVLMHLNNDTEVSDTTVSEGNSEREEDNASSVALEENASRESERVEDNAPLVAEEENKDCDSAKEQQNASLVDSTSATVENHASEELNQYPIEHENLVSFRAGSVIVLTHNEGKSLTAKMRCLVLKIRKTDENINQNVVRADVAGKERKQSVKDLELV